MTLVSAMARGPCTHRPTLGAMENNELIAHGPQPRACSEPALPWPFRVLCLRFSYPRSQQLPLSPVCQEARSLPLGVCVHTINPEAATWGLENQPGTLPPESTLIPQLEHALYL